jgi:hypothetical protein
MVSVLATAAFVACCLAFPVVLAYLIDRKAHEGVDWFKRRRVLRSGQEAEAQVLSSTVVEGTSTAPYKRAYSIVYEVTPAGAAPFRARAIEIMYPGEARANVEEGQRVQVRFDPADRTVVLVRPKPNHGAHDAARRAKEDALLRGP